MARVIVVNTPGPKGDKGDKGDPGPSGSISGFDSSSFLITSSFYQFTASYYIDSASFDSRINNLSPGGDISGYTTTASFNAFTSSYKIDSSSFQQSIIQLTNATSSYINSSQTSSFIKDNQTSSLSVLSASFSQTASFIDPLFISSSAASFGFGSETNVDTSSFVQTSSFNSFTSSYYLDSASFDTRISNIIFDISSLVIISSFNNFTSSYNTGSFSGSFIGTASWATSASQALTSSFIDPTFISASAAAAGFGSGGGVIETIGFRVYTDNSFITAGFKGYRHIGFDSNIIKVRSISNTNGNIDVNIKRDGNTLGTISLFNQSSSFDTILTDWSTQLFTNDLLEFHISQSSIFITDISIFIDIQSN
jgi:hypothetical protein